MTQFYKCVIPSTFFFFFTTEQKFNREVVPLDLISQNSGKKSFGERRGSSNIIRGTVTKNKNLYVIDRAWRGILVSLAPRWRLDDSQLKWDAYWEPQYWEGREGEGQESINVLGLEMLEPGRDKPSALSHRSKLHVAHAMPTSRNMKYYNISNISHIVISSKEFHFLQPSSHNISNVPAWLLQTFEIPDRLIILYLFI